MNKNRIPVFISDLTPDESNAKYSKARLKMYYIGETVDHRLFTEEFSNKLLSTVAYTPVVGYYSVSEEDFVGHNSTQFIYGIVPAEHNLEIVEEDGVKFAVVDVLLYTGRPDETGAIAAKIVGKQHSLELGASNLEYKINRDEQGRFKNLEYISGELVGLSVLGDNETPAFSGSEFFSAEDTPDFITDDNRDVYTALFTNLFTVAPTQREIAIELEQALEMAHIRGYVAEHIVDESVVVETDWYNFVRYSLSRDENGELQFTLEGPVRPRFLTDSEIENAKKGNSAKEPEPHAAIVTEAQAQGNASTAGASASAQTDEENNTAFVELQAQYDALVVEHAQVNDQLQEANNNCAAQAATIGELQTANDNLTREIKVVTINSYRNILDENDIADFIARVDEFTLEDLTNALNTKQTEIQENNTQVVVTSFTGVLPPEYDENDINAVVQKFLNK